MKKIFIVLPLFLSFFGFGQIDSASIIGQSVRIGNLEVAQYDFPNPMNWDTAKKICGTLGKGWRLPTKEELQLMYTELHKKGNGGFKASNYWSVSEDQNSMVYLFNFSYGFSISLAKEAKEPGKGNCWVRAVK